jgi:peptidoglycan/LPS O-acetylase OafA/YrhL
MSTFSRAWEFTGGSLLCLINKDLFKFKEIKINIIIAITIIILIAIAILVPWNQGKLEWFILITIINIISISYIYLSKSSKRCLSLLRPLSYLGIISYGFYLFHYPIIVFSRWVNGNLYIYEIIFIFIFTIVLSWLSYFHYELPLRKYILNNKN